MTTPGECIRIIEKKEPAMLGVPAQTRFTWHCVLFFCDIINQGEAIEGYIDIVKNNLEVELNVSNSHYSPGSHILKGFNIIRHSTKEDHKKLKNKSTWGYSVIVNMANKLFVANAK